MKERPIVFSDQMVNAIRTGAKGQTRRLVKHDGIVSVATRDEFLGCSPYPLSTDPTPGIAYVARACGDVVGLRAPFGVPGDRLWVRETWQYAPLAQCHCTQPSEASPCDDWSEGIGCRSHRSKVVYRADGTSAPRWRSPIFMPRWASRITLEINAVRIERLHDISEQDAREEGFSTVGEFRGYFGRLYPREPVSWDPWVWVISFAWVQTAAA